MMAPGHLTSSLGPAILTARALSVIGEPLAVCLTAGGLVVFAVLWPDLEAEKSTIKFLFKPVTLPLASLTRMVCWMVWRWTRNPEKDGRPKIHRGFTHTVPGCALFGLVTGLLVSSAPGGFAVAWCYGVAAFVGTMTHYFGDRVTTGGVPPLTWPIPNADGKVWYSVSWDWFEVNSPGETLFTWFALWPATAGALAAAVLA